ncbi:Uncharacterised protein [Enterobacter cloacae]|nr:Uncharacterised protein [Enterobacter cloacae]
MMVFIDVNCVDMAIPSTNSGRISIQIGNAADCRENCAIINPIKIVTPTSVLR